MQFLKPNDPARCKGHARNGWSSVQCSKRASTEAGYCKTHDPVLKKAKQEAAHDKWKAEFDKRSAISKVQIENELVGSYVRAFAGWSTNFPISFERTLLAAKLHEEKRNADLSK